jgi:hypothetical protein
MALIGSWLPGPRAKGSSSVRLSTCGSGGAGPDIANGLRSPEALPAEIDALKAPRVAWRAIAWKSCLLEGLKESRAKNKPALLWVFIDRPVDDARC